MKKQLLHKNNIPAVIWGASSDKIYLYVHGKSGCKEEAASFAELACAKGWQVLSMDLPEHGERKGDTSSFDPWHAVPELNAVYDYLQDGWKKTALFANSIGAWFSMLSFAGKPLEKALFVSPVLDMECLIRRMMQWADQTFQRRNPFLGILLLCTQSSCLPLGNPHRHSVRRPGSSDRTLRGRQLRRTLSLPLNRDGERGTLVPYTGTAGYAEGMDAKQSHIEENHPAANTKSFVRRRKKQAPVLSGMPVFSFAFYFKLRNSS